MSTRDRPKPDLNEFLLRSIPLREAIAIRSRWETLSEAEINELGFSDFSEASGEYFAGLEAPKRSSMN